MGLLWPLPGRFGGKKEETKSRLPQFGAYLWSQWSPPHIRQAMSSRPIREWNSSSRIQIGYSELGKRGMAATEEKTLSAAEWSLGCWLGFVVSHFLGGSAND